MLNISSLCSAGAMETGDHFKNGASSKSHTSRANFLRKAFIFMVMMAVMGLSANRIVAQSSTSDYSQWYLGGSTGISISGIDNIPDILSFQGAYFFNPKYGAGLAFNKRFEGIYSQSILSAAFFAHLGSSQSKWFFPIRVGLGLELTDRSIACYTSAGVAYKPIKWLSFGLNAEFASTFENDLEEGLGFSIGLGFHF